MQVNLLSFRQLDKQNFDISLTGNVLEKRFLIKSPTGASLDAYIDNKVDIYRIRPIACKVELRKDSKDQEDQSTAIPIATMEEWHRRLSHTHFRAILKLAQQKVLRIKSLKIMPFYNICRQAKQRR
jgi:hypothetical protein